LDKTPGRIIEGIGNPKRQEGKMKQVYVEIFEDETGKVQTCMGPMSEFAAERVMGGVSINLNHAEYSIRTVDTPTEPQT
jgi:hypothetical protein